MSPPPGGGKTPRCGVGRSLRYLRIELATNRALLVRTREHLPSFFCENATEAIACNCGALVPFLLHREGISKIRLAMLNFIRLSVQHSTKADSHSRGNRRWFPYNFFLQILQREGHRVGNHLLRDRML